MEEGEDTHPQRLLHDHDGDSRYTRIMVKLKDSVLSQLAAYDPSVSIDSHHASFIHRRLQQVFDSFHTPTHPPYALMIHRAVTELSEGTGSTEEAISEFIRREYKDLPWAHVRILGLHLTKLCEAGELVCTEAGRYMLLVDNGRLGDGEGTEYKGSKKRKRGNKRRDHGDGERKGSLEGGEGIERGNGLQEQEINEQIQVSELRGAGTNEPGRVMERQYEWTQEQGEAHQQSIERVKEQVESEKGQLGVAEKQSQSQWQGTGVIDGHTEAEKYQAQAQSEVEEPQIQMHSKICCQQEDSMSHLETISSPQPIALNLPGDSRQPLLVPISEGSPKCTPSAGIELSLMHMQLQMSCHEPSETGLSAAAKLSASLSSVDVHEHKLDENPVSGDPEQQPPKHRRRGRPPKCKPVADYPGESLLPSNVCIVTEQKPNVNKIGKQWVSQPQGRGRGRGRPRKLHRNAHQFKEQLQPLDQAQGLVSFPYSEPKEPIYSSHPTAPNIPENLTIDFGQQLVVPISEWSPECMTSTGIKLSPTLLQLHISPDIDLVTTSKMEASLSSVNVHEHKQPQHWNEGSSKGKLDENPMSGDPEQKPPKHPRRGKPPKLKPVADYPGELLLPSDDGILNYQKPNINNIEKQQHGRGRGRGRPRKLNQNTNQCEDQLQPQDQAQGLVSSPNPGGEDNQSSEQKQLQLQSRAQNPARRPTLESDVDESCQKQQLLPQVRRCRGRPPKRNTHVKQSQWQQLQTCQGQGQGQGQVQGPNQDLCLKMPPTPLSDANQSHQQLQPQWCEVQGRRRGRPPKQKLKQ